MSGEPSCSLLIGPPAAGLRHELGPTAWMVLEKMLLHSTAAGVYVITIPPDSISVQTRAVKPRPRSVPLNDAQLPLATEG